MNVEQKRKLEGLIALTLSSLAAAIGLFWLVFILGDVLIHGIGALNLGLFLNDPVPAGMAEYARRTNYAKIISVLADIIVSVPSIVIGTFIYAILVRPVHHFSGWAGAFALSLIMIPVVLRTTEDMLSMVPWTLREAAFALGAPYYKVIIQVVYRGAATGILTGILLSIARVAGETAPLLFTSFNNNFFSTNMNGPIASLTVTIFQYAMGPYEDWHAQAWAASFVITIFILVLTLAGRLVLKWRYK
jgi:phosphate transport system permease protein